MARFYQRIDLFDQDRIGHSCSDWPGHILDL